METLGMVMILMDPLQKPFKLKGPKPEIKSRTWRIMGLKVISPLIGVISNYKYSYLIYNPSY